MAYFNTRFYCEADDALYSDGAVENEIYERVCQKDTSLETDTNWTVFYHFSRLRHNILNWYPFKDGCSVLEIGGGCGALTGLLVQKAGRVTTCELTMRRAKILYERHKDASNLEVVVGNFLKATFDQKFDYVVVNGVLEYARGIMGSEKTDPYVAFLQQAKSYLNPGGIILLSIENRIGLKYLAGAAEDHVGKFFAGINGYCQGEHVQTFSQSELASLCEKAGLCIYKWYYPYPDYKFPTEIFTDDSVNSTMPTGSDVPFDMARAKLYDKQSVYHTLMDEHIAGHFSNSFLLELGEGQIHNCSQTPTYIKISNNRDRSYSICTLIYGNDGYVEKKALFPQGNAHLSKMHSAAAPMGLFHTVSSDYQNGTLICPIVKEESMHNCLKALVIEGNLDAFWGKIRLLCSSLYGDSTPKQCEGAPEFINVFGPLTVRKPLHWLPNINIDLNVDNIFCGDSYWTVIDNEWVFPFEIPAEYALWRMMIQLQEDVSFSSIVSESDIYNLLEISSEEVHIFRQWEVHFAQEYVGILDLSPHYMPEYSIDLAEVLEHRKQSQTLVSHLFLFSETGEVETLESYGVYNDGRWKVCFESDRISSATTIRWDPLEGNACRISEIFIENLAAHPVNADPTEPDFTFATFDPQFLLQGDWTHVSKIEINFQCNILEWTTGFFRMETDRDREHQLYLNEKALYKQIQEELEAERQASGQLRSELEAEHRVSAQWKESYESLRDELMNHKGKSAWKVINGKMF